jgi:hypothetical protein
MSDFDGTWTTGGNVTPEEVERAAPLLLIAWENGEEQVMIGGRTWTFAPFVVQVVRPPDLGDTEWHS